MSTQRPLHNPPVGQEPYDEGALNDSQQMKTNTKKVMIRAF
jgi:hypothetical protein